MASVKENSLPAWTLEDAYGSVTDERFLKEKAHTEALAEELTKKVPAKATVEDVLQLIPIYEEAVEGASSLYSFARCAYSQNVTDSAANSAIAECQALIARLEAIVRPLFVTLGSLEDSSEHWKDPRIAHWKFTAMQGRNSWKSALNSTQLRIIDKFAASNFYPLDAQYKRLNKGLKVEVQNSKGETLAYKQSQCLSVLKGVADPVLRESTQNALNAWYKAHADHYVDILNALHGFRKVQFEEAGVDWLTPSLEQNRMSKGSIEALLSCVDARKETLQEAIRLRAPYFGQAQMKACDFLAPAPSAKGATKDYIPYEEAISTVKKALIAVNPELPEFIDMMLEKHWLEARVDPNKAGGAFYSRFNRFKQARVFTSYIGSFASMIQQSHELGHAFHYWVMRDLPTVQTEFPMTLTEVASTFNEANVRHYCTVNSQSDDEKFTILWQELKSVTNFCLHQPVRMEFEKRFIALRQHKVVTTQEAETIMEEAWRKWFGDSTIDIDPYLWAYKMHFYKTDQYIYNYPYMVGYLISQGLRKEQEKRGDQFPEFYRAFLRDTGRMTVDELIQKHMGYDPAGPEFWNQCLDVACSYIEEFKKLIAKKN